MWIEDGTADSLIKQRRVLTARRNNIAAEILSGLEFVQNLQGNHIWLTLPDRWSAESLQQASQENGVLIYSASSFAVEPNRAPNAVRIALGASQTEFELIEGLKTNSTSGW